MPAKKTNSKPSAPRTMDKKSMKRVKGGGTQDVTLNKVKTAEKTAAALDAYIRG